MAMTPIELSQWLLESNYSYSTIQIDAPPEIGDRIIEWGKLNIPDNLLFVDDDGGKGRETESHITVKYGLTVAEVPEVVYRIAHTTKPFPVLVGKVSLFRNPSFDVVKCDIESPWLRRINATISSSVPNEDTHPNYTPHLTVAYVKRGTCDRLEGMDVFEEGSNEFIAYGMIFKGSGEDDDPSRVKEVLLFSKVKQHQTAAVAMTEAVTGPSRAEMRQVREIIQQAQTQCGGDEKLFVELANDGLARFGVKFEQRREMSTGAPAVADGSGIYLQPPSSWAVRDTDLADRCHTLIYHELVHGWQMSKMPNPTAVADRATRYMMPNGQTINHDRYLQQKQEVMAHAASMVDGWERQKLTANEMTQRLRTGRSWGFGEKYWYARKKYPQIFNRFVKYATDYIAATEKERLGESEEADPQGYVDRLNPKWVVKSKITGYGNLNQAGGELYLVVEFGMANFRPDIKQATRFDSAEDAQKAVESIRADFEQSGFRLMVEPLPVYESKPNVQVFQAAMQQALAEILADVNAAAFGGVDDRREQGRRPKDGYDINCGMCEDWAMRVRDIYMEKTGLDHVEVVDPVGVYDDPGDEFSGHIFVRFGGRYYDAECPQGVRNWRKLPLFVKNLGEGEEDPDPERYIDELAPSYVIRHVETGHLMSLSGGFSGSSVCHFSSKADAENAKFKIPWLHKPEDFEVIPVFPKLGESMPKDPRNGPEKANYAHADAPDPYKDMPFPADSGRLRQFVRGRRKKRAARPVL